MNYIYRLNHNYSAKMRRLAAKSKECSFVLDHFVTETGEKTEYCTSQINTSLLQTVHRISRQNAHINILCKKGNPMME